MIRKIGNGYQIRTGRKEIPGAVRAERIIMRFGFWEVTTVRKTGQLRAEGLLEEYLRNWNHALAEKYVSHDRFWLRFAGKE